MRNQQGHSPTQSFLFFFSALFLSLFIAQVQAVPQLTTPTGRTLPLSAVTRHLRHLKTPLSTAALTARVYELHPHRPLRFLRSGAPPLDLSAGPDELHTVVQPAEQTRFADGLLLTGPASTIKIREAAGHTVTYAADGSIRFITGPEVHLVPLHTVQHPRLFVNTLLRDRSPSSSERIALRNRLEDHEVSLANSTIQRGALPGVRCDTGDPLRELRVLLVADSATCALYGGDIKTMEDKLSALFAKVQSKFSPASCVKVQVVHRILRCDKSKDPYEALRASGSERAFNAFTSSIDLRQHHVRADVALYVAPAYPGDEDYGRFDNFIRHPCGALSGKSWARASHNDDLVVNIIAHELGHHLGLGHSERGIMSRMIDDEKNKQFSWRSKRALSFYLRSNAGKCVARPGHQHAYRGRTCDHSRDKTDCIVEYRRLGSICGFPFGRSSSPSRNVTVDLRFRSGQFDVRVSAPTATDRARDGRKVSYVLSQTVVIAEYEGAGGTVVEDRDVHQKAQVTLSFKEAALILPVWKKSCCGQRLVVVVQTKQLAVGEDGRIVKNTTYRKKGYKHVNGMFEYRVPCKQCPAPPSSSSTSASYCPVCSQ